MEPSQLPVSANTFPELREKQVQHLWPLPIEFSKEHPLADSRFEGIDSRRCLTADWVSKSPDHLRRFMWKLFIGPIYDKQYPSLNVINSCWNPYCINPFHLRLFVPEGSLALVETW